MTKITYLGDVSGKWRAPGTCTWYAFCPEDKVDMSKDYRHVRYVDNRDLGHFLSLFDEHGEPLFVRG
jgi:hypothetical protein